MKALDVVNQLRAVLPRYTNVFSTGVAISSVVAAGGTATVTTAAPHTLAAGEIVSLTGFNSRAAIDSVSKAANVYTFTTALGHDLTEGWFDSVVFEGFTAAEWNARFTLLSVPNRKTFTVQSTESLPALTGSEVLLENRANGVNGAYTVANPTPTTFDIVGSFPDGAYTNGTVHSDVRICASIDTEQMVDLYTAQELPDYWLYVVMGDQETSKDRNTHSDATTTLATGFDFRVRIIDRFNLYIFINTKDKFSAADAADIARHDLLSPILQSIFGVRFETGVSGGGDFAVVPTRNGRFSYERAFYIHEYAFETTFDLTHADGVQPNETSAFRDVEITQTVGTADMTATVDLDDLPIS
jgi:hypothetical protein